MIRVIGIELHKEKEGLNEGEETSELVTSDDERLHEEEMKDPANKEYSYSHYR